MTDLLSDFRHSVNVGDLASVKACVAKLTPQSASKKIDLSSLTQRDSCGTTIIHKAVLGGQLELIRQLLSIGVPLDAPDINNQTALHLALNRNRLDIVKALIAERPKFLCDTPDNWGRTILHLACTKNDFELVNLLIEFGCSINVADHKGWTPLHYAVSYNRLQVIETLLHKSAVLNATNREGYTPLHVAALQCYDKLVELLAELNGADTNTRSTDGQTPLHLAVRSGNPKSCKILLEQDADNEAHDSYGTTPLDLAANDKNLLQVVAGTPTKAKTHSQKCIIKEIYPVVASVRITQGFTIQARDKFGRNRSVGADPFVVTVLHAASFSSSDITCKQKDLGNGEYHVVWRTTQVGKHVVKVQLNGKDIGGSPLEIYVSPNKVEVQEVETTSLLSTPQAKRKSKHPVLAAVAETDSVKQKKLSSAPVLLNPTENIKLRRRSEKSKSRSASPSPPGGTPRELDGSGGSNSSNSGSAPARPSPSSLLTEVANAHTFRSAPILAPGSLDPLTRGRRGSTPPLRNRDDEWNDEYQLPAVSVTVDTSLTRQRSVYAPMKRSIASSGSAEAILIDSSASRVQADDSKKLNRRRSGSRPQQPAARTTSSESLDIAKIETLRRENAVLMQKVVELQHQLDAKQEEKQEMLQKEEEDRQKMISLAKLVQREREQLRCTNCTRPRDTVLIPCKHFVLCSECASDISHCTVCGQEKKHGLSVLFS